MERAADWVFSHAAELDTESMDTDQEPPATTYLDGPGSKYVHMRTQTHTRTHTHMHAQSMTSCFSCSTEYQLIAFISHMGTSTMCGHYVCHIIKDGRWVIYNDEKVAVSESPPRELGYLYLYQRVQ